ncbi:EAL domain-containing protein [Campylobacter sp. MG1]|uniref:EAL domain-containing protein n=1 Tax=Campylobacter sp. MG1 TaxID=2976332 RepID=UPI00226D203F|nr:GGDEF domain-containing protein [Campylobacter sp. MG1]
MKKIKKSIYFLVCIFLILNLYLFMDSKKYIKVFAENYFNSLKDKHNDFTKFRIIDNKIITINGVNPNLDEEQIKELANKNKIFNYLKTNKDNFDITYYVLYKNYFQGFQEEFKLDNANTYQFYISFLINICLLIFIFILHKQRNITENQYIKTIATCNKKIEKLELEANIDNLTQLKNKKNLEKNINIMKNPKILLVDIDEFNKINNYFDSETANDLLKHIALIIDDFAKENNMQIYRVNGDLFALLEDSIDDEKRYEFLSKKLIEELANKDLSIEYNNQTINIILTVTMGCCVDDDDILKKAMVALKKAKLNNKNFVCYSKFIDNETNYFNTINTNQISIENIHKNEILPFFQPVFDKDKNITHYETLVRMTKKTKDGIKIILPDEFLLSTIKMKQYKIIEEYIFEKVIQILLENNNIILSINLSSQNMNDSIKNNEFITLLRKNMLGNRLIIEIIEDEKMPKNEKIKDFIKRTRELGCKIIIDNFGYGTNNFAYLVELMPDYIKFHSNIIKNINASEKNANIVKAIVSFSKELGIKTIAKHISDEKILQKCIELEIDEFQGFYLGKPSPTFSLNEIDLEFYKIKE